MVSARSHRVSRVPWYSGSCRVSPGFGYGALTLSGRLFQSRSPAVTESLMQSEPRDARITVWALPRSLAATYGIDVSFSSSGYLDVSVPRVPFHKLWIHLWMTVVHTAGFPHSEISGSKDICSSPKLFAAYHVFHRLLVPRHPPCALISLTKRFSFAGADYSSQMHSVASLVWVVYKICCIVFHMINHLITWPRMS